MWLYRFAKSTNFPYNGWTERSFRKGYDFSDAPRATKTRAAVFFASRLRLKMHEISTLFFLTPTVLSVFVPRSPLLARCSLFRRLSIPASIFDEEGDRLKIQRRPADSLSRNDKRAWNGIWKSIIVEYIRITPTTVNTGSTRLEEFVWEREFYRAKRAEHSLGILVKENVYSSPTPYQVYVYM